MFEYPNSVAIDARGRVYVADTFNDRVQIWSY
jgi:sugar lactone lactonase YvrE